MNVLAISAHPDDETAGCGGALLAHRDRGDALYWLILTKAYAPRWTDAVIETKEREVEAVAGAYGMKDVFWPGLKTTTLESIGLNAVIDPIREAVEQVRPEVVYTVHRGDIHTDHQVVFDATTIVLKPFYMRKLGVGRLLSFECLSSTEAAPPMPERHFAPQVFQDVSPYLERKLEVMALYESEAQPDPYPRGPSAIRALARYRGATISVEYAEAFMLIQEVR